MSSNFVQRWKIYSVRFRNRVTLRVNAVWVDMHLSLLYWKLKGRFLSTATNLWVSRRNAPPLHPTPRKFNPLSVKSQCYILFETHVYFVVQSLSIIIILKFRGQRSYEIKKKTKLCFSLLERKVPSWSQGIVYVFFNWFLKNVIKFFASNLNMMEKI